MSTPCAFLLGEDVTEVTLDFLTELSRDLEKKCAGEPELNDIGDGEGVDGVLGAGWRGEDDLDEEGYCDGDDMDDSLLGSGTGRFPRPCVLISLPATVCIGWTPWSPEPETWSPVSCWLWPEELATRGFGNGSKNKGI